METLFLDADYIIALEADELENARKTSLGKQLGAE
jgi:hypothetical protein